MGNSQREMMPISTSYTPDAAQLPTSLTGIASPMPPRAPEVATEPRHGALRFDLSCIDWEPNPEAGSSRLGWATLVLLPLGLELHRVNLIRTAAGHLRVSAPKAGKRGAGGAFRFSSDGTWHAFSRAAEAAVRRFDAHALPIDRPTTATRRAPILAAATTPRN